jgi:hypothetical protein
MSSTGPGAGSSGIGGTGMALSAVKGGDAGMEVQATMLRLRRIRAVDVLSALT